MQSVYSFQSHIACIEMLSGVMRPGGDLFAAAVSHTPLIFFRPFPPVKAATLSESMLTGEKQATVWIQRLRILPEKPLAILASDGMAWGRG